MIGKNQIVEIDNLTFTHEDHCDSMDIYVEDKKGNSASLACALGEGVFSNNDTPLTKSQYATCILVENYAVNNNLY